MKVAVRHDPTRDHVEAFVFEDFGGQRRALVQPMGRPATWVDVQDGAEPPALLDVPYDVWQFLWEEATGVERPTRAQADALEDAKEVRDRLLTLVEATHGKT